MPTMRVLLDEGLPRRAAALLRDAGTDAFHLTELESPATADAAILKLARKTNRIIVTLDADFHALLAEWGWSGPSVIRIRRQGMSAEEVRDLALRLIRDHGEALLAGVALSVRGHLVGMRILPLVGGRSEMTEPEDDD